MGRIDRLRLARWIGIGLAVLVFTGGPGCVTETPKPAAKSNRAPSVQSSKPGDTPQRRALAAARACRVYLHLIQDAKRQWAQDNGKADTEVPGDEDLFGPDAYIRDKLQCPVGGTYTLRAVEDVPLCSTPGHTY
jgi:hypothetical protein